MEPRKRKGQQKKKEERNSDSETDPQDQPTDKEMPKGSNPNSKVATKDKFAKSVEAKVNARIKPQIDNLGVNTMLVKSIKSTISNIRTNSFFTLANTAVESYVTVFTDHFQRLIANPDNQLAPRTVLQLNRYGIALLCMQLFYSLSNADQQGFDVLQTLGGVQLQLPIPLARRLSNFGEFDTDLGKARITNGGNAVLGLAANLHDPNIQASVQRWYADHPCSNVQQERMKTLLVQSKLQCQLPSQTIPNFMLDVILPNEHAMLNVRTNINNVERIAIHLQQQGNNNIPAAYLTMCGLDPVAQPNNIDRYESAVVKAYREYSQWISQTQLPKHQMTTVYFDQTTHGTGCQLVVMDQFDGRKAKISQPVRSDDLINAANFSMSVDQFDVFTQEQLMEMPKNIVLQHAISHTYKQI